MSHLWVLVSGGQGTIVREYPYSPAKLRADNPDTSFPRGEDLEWLARERVMPVTPTERPAYHPSKLITEADPKRIDGVWTQVWMETAAEAPTVEQLVDYAKNCRRDKEFGGITVLGVPVETDERAQMKITGARVAANADPEWTTVWSGADGGSYPVNTAAIVAISDAVLDHVSGCFTDFAAVKAGIDAGTITTYAQVEEAFA